jgi:hypothetical protein
MLGWGIWTARLCNLIAGLALFGVIFAIAMHIAPPVVHGADGEARAYEAGWDLVGVLAGFSVFFWLLARAIAITVERRLEREFEEEDF